MQDNHVKRIVDQNSKVEDIKQGQGAVLLYEINPELNPQLPDPDLSSKSDSNYGISEDWTKSVLMMMAP